MTTRCKNPERMKELHTLCTEHGIKLPTLIYRLGTGWLEQDAIVAPKHLDVIFKGKKVRNLKKFCKTKGVPYSTFRSRIADHGWSVEKALSHNLDKIGSSRPKTLLTDYVGQVYGKLTVLTVHRLNGKTYCTAKCDCGSKRKKLKDKLYNLNSMRQGKVKSCGCLRRGYHE